MSQFEEFDGKPMQCAVFEAMCPEAVDGSLSAAEQRAFDKHVAGCVVCAQELAEAQRGAAWMAMLKGHAPEPPAALLQRILAETTGAVVPVIAAIPAMASHPATIESSRGWGTRSVAARPSQWASFRAKLSDVFSMDTARMTFQPRLAMTAAMAFFSIALTLNMAGVRLRDLRTGMLQPSSLRHTVADAGASATRSFQNLRVVYEVESRVSDLRNNSGLDSKFGDNRRDPAGPFESGPASRKSAGPSSTPAPQNAPEQNKPQQSTPQGKSDLEFLVIKPASAARKGA